MNSEITLRQDIARTLQAFDTQPLREAATEFLNTLGYRSQRVGYDGLDSEMFNRLRDAARKTTNPSNKLCIDEWDSFYQIMQITDAEVNQQGSLFESSNIDANISRSYMFVAIQLTGDSYTRTQLADITRLINRRLDTSILVMFRYGSVLSLAIINRRLHKRDDTKRVLEKVTLIKDIRLDAPNRAHIDILSELNLHRLIETEGVHNFDTLHTAWEAILNTEGLNKRFYRDLETWYEWAVTECRFPDDANEMQVIRMITRLLFVWFLKQKGLVPAELFETEPLNPPPVNIR